MTAYISEKSVPLKKTIAPGKPEFYNWDLNQIDLGEHSSFSMITPRPLTEIDKLAKIDMEYLKR